jgi:hypothetical protein
MDWAEYQLASRSWDGSRHKAMAPFQYGAHIDSFSDTAGAASKC